MQEKLWRAYEFIMGPIVNAAEKVMKLIPPYRGIVKIEKNREKWELLEKAGVLETLISRLHNHEFRKVFDI